MIKYFKYIIYTNSLLISIPIAYFIKYLIELKDIYYGVVRSAPAYQETTFMGWNVFLFVLLLVLVISSFILGVKQYRDSADKAWLFSCLLSGFITLWIASLVKIFKKNKPRLKRKNFIFYSSTFAVSASVLSIPFIAFASISFGNIASTKAYGMSSAEIYYSNPEVSTDPETPNVIDIFTDGFSFPLLKQVLTEEQNKTLSDFFAFDKFVTRAFFTTGSYSKILMGDTDFGDSHGYRVTFDNFFNKETPSNYGKDKKFYVGNNGPLGAHTRWQSYSNNISEFKKELPNVSLLNWRLGQDLLDNHKVSPAAAPFEAFNYELHKGTSSSSMLYDDILHHPYIVSSDGEFDPYTGSQIKSYRTVAKLYCDLVRKLKSIKGSGPGETKDAFDNTTIFIWGDHSSHEIPPLKEYTKIKSNDRLKNESSLMVKPLAKYSSSSKYQAIYRKTGKGITEIHDRAIYGPDYRWITHYAYGDLADANKPEGFHINRDPLEFIMTNKHFDIDKKMFATMYSTKKQSWVFTHYVPVDNLYEDYALKAIDQKDLNAIKQKYADDIEIHSDGWIRNPNKHAGKGQSSFLKDIRSEVGWNAQRYM